MEIDDEMKNLLFLTEGTMDFGDTPQDEIARGLLALLVERLGHARVQTLLASLDECKGVEDVC